jgi:hypothetical protein
MVRAMLHRRLDLRDTLRVMRAAERRPLSRFRIGSPCRALRVLDAAIHLLLPELLEDRCPSIASRLRRTSPRWGRSWQALS